MKKIFLLLLLPILLFACNNKKKVIAEGDKVEVSDLVQLFNDIKLPFQLADSLLLKKSNDSFAIPYKVFVDFFPDSIIAKQFGKGAKPTIYAIGKTAVKGSETYLFVKAATAAKKVAYIIALDKELQFSAAMPFVIANKDAVASSANFDSKYTITTLTQKKASNNELLYHKDVYVYNAAGAFTLILTESNDKTKINTALINPLDTLSAKNKLAGDYLQDKKNMVSFRDGKTAEQLLVFIHFEKMNGECNGELKGVAKLVNANTAILTESGSSCEIQFQFKGNNVVMKEQGGCGSHRDIKCFFEGSYNRKKIAATKKKISSKK